MANAMPTNIKMAKTPATVKPMLQAKKLRIKLHKLEEGWWGAAGEVFLESVILKRGFSKRSVRWFYRRRIDVNFKPWRTDGWTAGQGRVSEVQGWIRLKGVGSFKSF
jgi:hypothetical protein